MPDIAIQNSAKVKQFFWDVKDRRSIERGIGGIYNNDTTQKSVNFSAGVRTNIVTYTFTFSALTNKARIRVYGYYVTNGYYLYLNVNGTDLTNVLVGNTSSALILDYIFSVNPNASNTIKLDAYNGLNSGTAVLTQVIIIAGFGLTSTTSVSILSITLDSVNDVYTLNVSGNFVYKVGIRWWVKGNRKTTASATIISNLANEIQGGYSPSAGDDGDNNVFLTLRTGDYATSFTISGYVGATGNTIIITGIYCQIILRGANADTLKIKSDWGLLIREKGLIGIASRHVTIDGSNQFIGFYIITKNGSIRIYYSSAGPDVVVGNLVFVNNDAPECAWHLNYNEDTYGFSIHLYVNIIVLGV